MNGNRLAKHQHRFAVFLASLSCFRNRKRKLLELNGNGLLTIVRRGYLHEIYILTRNKNYENEKD
jgi:hypothetical protein